MLGTDHGQVTFDAAWGRLPQRANVPYENFLDAAGVTPTHPSERRRFVRFRCRRPVILLHNNDRLAGYSVDVSRSGMAIISPVQFFPCECVDVLSPQQRVTLRIIRCLRLGASCYQCACEFLRSGDA